MTGTLYWLSRLVCRTGLRGERSALLCRIKKGKRRELKRSASSSSSLSNRFAVITRMAISARGNCSKVLLTRCLPSSPSSSIPAVSTKITEAKPGISKLFFTGSVVVPGISETIAIFCPVKALMSELLPLLRRPVIRI